MASAREWIEGARLRTLPASVSPVVTGTGLAQFGWDHAWPSQGLVSDAGGAWTVIAPLLCLVVAVAIQVGSNLSNDYSDGIRGTDAHRVGPQRLVGSGAASPRHVKRAALAAYGLAGLAGMVLLVWYGRWYSGETWRLVWHQPSGLIGRPGLAVVLLVAGVACIVAAWFYTGGRHPYGYAGLGEVFVFIFYGLVATIGTALVQTDSRCYCVDGPDGGWCGCVGALSWPVALLTGSVMGLICVNILVANNLRDLQSDKAVGKNTLATRMGDRATRWLYIGLTGLAEVGVVAIAALTSWWALLGLIGVNLVAWHCWRVWRGAEGRELIVVLKWTGLAELAAAIGLFVGWVIAV